MKKLIAISLAFLTTSSIAADFPSGAEFYKNKNYEGYSHFYDESGSVYSLPKELNDYFHSVKVGQLSKVFAWKHYSESQPGDKHQEWTEDNPDISSLGGLSKFKVTPKEVEGVLIRLVDGIETGKKYCMSSKVYGEGEGADVYSCTNNESYQLVGTLNPTNGEESIVASIATRNMENSDPNFGQYINNGSVYFKVEDGGDIEVSHENGEFDNFPENLNVIEVRENTFDVILISEVPDFD
ncbi:beta/gamma crystallin domain-containing protein [Vibrio jasicida]|uniref:beta/gamma crystallin domain-containing protein n=1 Tax=Vibrio jasicida TaxID=766224 RepID=UPI0003A07415|nr:beta/gamma crystallin domain-containing protein [Vibrio jasicida]